MPIYKIIRKETERQYAYVDARSKAKAEQYAECLSDESWHDFQDYNNEIVAVVKAESTDLQGRIIEKTNGKYYNFDNKKIK